MYKKALSSLTILFFMMGFITCLNDILVPYLKAAFELSYTQAALVQFCFFGAYSISIPAAKIVEKLGYFKTMVLGFCILCIGCLLFLPAMMLEKFEVFLAALFVLGCGIVLLQVTANPYVASIGTKETASSRLSLVQAFNSLGTFIAPLLGAYFLLDHITKSGEALKYPYMMIAGVLLIIAVTMAKILLPKLTETTINYHSWKKVIREPGLLSGMIGIFAYVGAEVAIGSFFVNYVSVFTDMSHPDAAKMLALFWGASLVGRFIGVLTLREFSPGKVLSIHSMLAIALILISTNSRGMMSVYSMILVGFCNSIMFPTIFALAIKNLNFGEEQKASGLLGTSIIGGALIPLVTGFLLDSMGFRAAFLLPVVCYAYIGLFGMKHTEAKELSTQNVH